MPTGTHSMSVQRDPQRCAGRASYHEYGMSSPTAPIFPSQQPGPPLYDPQWSSGTPTSMRPVEPRHSSPTRSSISSDRSDDVEALRYQGNNRGSISQPYRSQQLPPHESPRYAAYGPAIAMDQQIQGYHTYDGRYQPSQPSYYRQQTTAPFPRPPSPKAGSDATKHIPITSLLSGGDSSSPSEGKAKNVAIAPRPPGYGSTSRTNYHIFVRQQPTAARSCGFGERDRRVIDPPPIVQLDIKNPDVSADEISRMMRHPYAVCHCTIWDETGEQDSSAMPEDYRQQRRLMGTLVSSPFVGLDEDGEEGCFFCFPDLSCRTPGAFRLKFALVMLDPSQMRAGGSSPVVANAMSEVFVVYNAKDFPGMQASTALTKKLKEQGCPISIKKGNEKTNARNHNDSDDDDHDDEGGYVPASKGRKRQKTG